MIKLKNYFHVAESFFSEDFCDNVIDKIENGPYTKDLREEKYRLSDVIFFPQDEDTKWIYEPLEKLIDEVKTKNWRTFKLDKFQDLQYTIYDKIGGKYDWHCDTGQSLSGMERRLLSITVQLTDPATYSGGEFQIVESMVSDINKVVYGQSPEETAANDKIKTIIPPRGSVIIFPSVISHRVCAMKSGTRKSLVGWMNGTFI
jgi:PKHD-type hydroxylase